MSLAEIQEATGVPADHIIEALGLPADVRHEERLGALRTLHGFSIAEVRRIVQAYQQSGAERSGK